MSPCKRLRFETIVQQSPSPRNIETPCKRLRFETIVQLGRRSIESGSHVRGCVLRLLCNSPITHCYLYACKRLRFESIVQLLCRYQACTTHVRGCVLRALCNAWHFVKYSSDHVRGCVLRALCNFNQNNEITCKRLHFESIVQQQSDR